MPQEKDRLDYQYKKKALLTLLFVFYLSNVSPKDVVLRSFGFHFDPTCDFKAIVTSKKGHLHKYTVHIFSALQGVNLEKLDVMGNVNIVRVASLKDDHFVPEASLNIYFADDDFAVTGYAEGREVSYRTAKNRKKAGLLSCLNEEKDVNEAADCFMLWLLRFYAGSLPTDLVMGAGINKDYGAKTWGELINALNETFFTGDSEAEKEIKHYVGQELFTNSTILRTKGFDTYESLNHELYEFKESKSFNDPDSTLYKCVDFLEAHPGTEVITYNYDTNLEYLLKKRGLLYSTIYDESSFALKKSLTCIYHVHGLLPYDRYHERRFVDSLVFNEADYYDLYNNPYSWNVAKQLHDFKFHCCLFLGISLTDPDMKRLLGLGSNLLKFNFIFMKREEGFREEVYRDISAYFFSFDLLVIWVDDYGEIGGWLKAL